MRVLVVGAGVVGANVAYRLAEAGAEVVVVEAGEPAGETSARSFAWVNSRGKHQASYHRLRVDAMEAHRRLASQLAPADFLHDTGTLVYAADEPRAETLRANVERLRELGYPAELIDAAQARELEPAVHLPNTRAIGYFAREGWVDGPALVGRLLVAAQRNGAELRTRTAIDAVEPRADGVAVRIGRVAAGSGQHPRRAAGAGPALAVTTDQSWIEADVLVIAAGRFADRVAGLVGAHVPLDPTTGLLAVTTPIAEGPRRICYLPGVQLRREPTGRYVLQNGDTDDEVTFDTPERADLAPCQTLLARVQRFVPDLADARIEAARIGIRAYPSDGLPMLGFLPGQPRVYLAVTHSAMTLGPLLGELVAAEVAGRPPDERLAPFRPDRLVGSAPRGDRDGAAI